jgi:hypothetical protein
LKVSLGQILLLLVKKSRSQWDGLQHLFFTSTYLVFQICGPNFFRSFWNNFHFLGTCLSASKTLGIKHEAARRKFRLKQLPIPNCPISFAKVQPPFSVLAHRGCASSPSEPRLSEGPETLANRAKLLVYRHSMASKVRARAVECSWGVKCRYTRLGSLSCCASFQYLRDPTNFFVYMTRHLHRARSKIVLIEK